MKRALSALVSLTLIVLLSTGCSKSSTATSGGGGGASSNTVASTVTSGSATTSGTSCPTSASGFAKTKFLTHAGLGIGAFHRYLYKPYRAGAFQKGANGRIKAFLKAGAAALFIKREIRLAAEAAKQSPALCKTISAPLAKIGDTVSSAVASLRSGDASGITGLQSVISTVKGQASKNGNSITEANPTI